MWGSKDMKMLKSVCVRYEWPWLFPFRGQDTTDGVRVRVTTDHAFYVIVRILDSTYLRAKNKPA